MILGENTMKNPIKPLIDELKIRKQENNELQLSVLQEIERLRTERENKPKSKIRKIGFVDNIANKISNANDEKMIKSFQEHKQRELAIIREQRKQNYFGSIFVLIGVLILLIAIIITIGAICEKNNPNKVSNESTIEQQINTEIPSDNNISEKEQLIEENTEDGLPVDNSETTEQTNDTHELSDAENEYESEILEEDNTVSETENSNNTTDTVTETYHNERMVWIPTNGGNKYHSKPSCSKMQNPEEVSLEQAEKRGYTACKKCN